MTAKQAFKEYLKKTSRNSPPCAISQEWEVFKAGYEAGKKSCGCNNQPFRGNAALDY